MTREQLVEEFLDRLETAISADVEPGDHFEPEDFDPESITATASLDRDAVRTALDRLFKDLRDFCGEIHTDKKYVVFSGSVDALPAIEGRRITGFKTNAKRKKVK